MCAIAGIVSLDSINGQENALQTMLQAMAKRGPDGSYHYKHRNFLGGMCRLSINDVANGAQPFKNTRGDVVVFFNGEIYNYPALKWSLQQDGVVFKSHCDGEILPFLYEKYGVECFAQLEGMFGICIYDKRVNKVILGRDILGEKPLFYCKSGDKFCFCTLCSPLKKVCEVSLNPLAIWDFLTFGFIVEPSSVYKEVFALPKGSYLELDCKDLEFCIKDFKKQSLKQFSINSSNFVETTREIVTQSVTERLLSDVPVGAFLSGGLDSSIVVGLASQGVENLHTFNIAFSEGYDPYCGFVNESAFARSVAKAFKTEHFEIKVDAKSYQAHLMEFVENIDEPFGAVSGIGVGMIAKKAREMGVKVLLSGDGADEMFGGYSWYPKLRFNNPKFITKQKPKGWHYYAFESEKREMLSKEFFRNLDSRVYFPKRDSKPLEFIDFDREFYLPFEMMVKLDRMCMGQSVEGRACFVSPRILSFVKGLSYEELLAGGEKWLLKEAFKEMLPSQILQREKHGFNPPIDYWIKKDWLWLLKEVFAQGSALQKLRLLESGAEAYFMDLLGRNDRRVGNIAFYLIVLNLWLEREFCL
ncbi:asparagine synthase (glutamine-hydrolyzing) [Helicobacter sp.]|uniref:asparagine synthase (glutamine-hydrolyzing) n=1 Tax=Helicobacter sp. TaxID=218 RepID=UPI002A748465|nr:asparagine synthase (glutamine-hydrolyzing) [Helicobacter sp.]MDY2584241.1 asparagine synthase (glutamine-hydrolyzing) [Helicobacter sp.]